MTYASRLWSCTSACKDSGIATMAEYILLLGVSLAVFLALFAAFSVAAATADNDATAIAAENVASMVSAAICDTVGDGTVSASVSLDLPANICGREYMVYPSEDGRQLLVGVNRAHDRKKFASPVPLPAGGIRTGGFIVSGSGEMRITYDAKSRMVAIS